MATIACSMPASVYSRVARKKNFSTLSLRSAVENGSFSSLSLRSADENYYCNGRGLGPGLEAGSRLYKRGSPRGLVSLVSWSLLVVCGCWS